MNIDSADKLDGDRKIPWREKKNEWKQLWLHFFATPWFEVCRGNPADRLIKRRRRRLSRDSKHLFSSLSPPRRLHEASGRRRRLTNESDAPPQTLRENNVQKESISCRES